MLNITLASHFTMLIKRFERKKTLQRRTFSILDGHFQHSAFMAHAEVKRVKQLGLVDIIEVPCPRVSIQSVY